MKTNINIPKLTKRIALLTAVGGALAVSAMAFSGHHNKCDQQSMGKHGGKMPLAIMEEVLDLTPQQSEEIQAIRERARETHKEARTERKRDGGVKSLDPADANYLTQVEELATEKSERMAAHMIEKAKVHAEIYAMLTPEQQEKMKEFKAKMKERNPKYKDRKDEVTQSL